MTAHTGHVPVGYSLDAFEDAVAGCATVLERVRVSAAGRTLFALARREDRGVA